MSFFNAENFLSTTGGRWLVQPKSKAGLRGVGIDSREDLRNKAFIAIKGDRFDGHDFLRAAANAGASLLIVQHDEIPNDLPSGIGVMLVDDARKALGRLAHAYRQTLHGTAVIAVAGSAGKTTTKLLIEAALAGSMRGTVSPKSFNNDIGVPLTILSAQPGDQYLIVEVGTNHLGEIAPLAAMVEPDIAVITMIGREHLEGLGSLSNIARENAALLDHLRASSVAVVNADSPELRRRLASAKSIILFGEAQDADIRLTDRGENAPDKKCGPWWLELNGASRFDLSLPGRHNAVNALAAVAVARHLGVNDEQISIGLARAHGPPMRMERQEIGAITLYNDAYNANPDSMIAALATFAEVAATAPRRIIVLGDMLELGEAGPELHREIGRYLLSVDSHTPIDLAFFIGELSAFAAAEVARQWPGARLMSFAHLDSEASQRIVDLLQPNDAVLLKGSRGMQLERLAQELTKRHQDRSTFQESTANRNRPIGNAAIRGGATSAKTVAKR